MARLKPFRLFAHVTLFSLEQHTNMLRRRCRRAKRNT